MAPSRNIELKARLHHWEAARHIAQRIVTKYLGIQQQTDTYFHCPDGRMKLREIVEFASPDDFAISRAARSQAQLIWYERADTTESTESQYMLVDIASPERVQQLKREMGIRGIVVKQREIFLHHNVRIHLDQVDGLGTFIEFESVLSEGVDEANGHAQLARLQQEFGIAPADLLASGYADMLLKESG